MAKTVIYQLLPRLLSSQTGQQRPFGTIEENGCGKFNDLTPRVLQHIRARGATHVWYTGILRHATTTDYRAYGIPTQHPSVVKGRAGSPYAVADYYDVDPDLAVDPGRRMEEWQALVERTHRAGMKVIVDFVPNHVAREYRSVCRPAGVRDLGEDDDTAIAFSPQNNFYYLPSETFSPSFDIGTYRETPARATGNDRFDAHPEPCDWYDTVKLNYGCPPLCTYHPTPNTHHPIPPTWRQMCDILLYWAGLGVDGFRCDMAHMVPTAFWEWCLPQVKAAHPGLLFIAEVYDAGLYRPLLRTGFDLLYDKIGMYDTLIGVSRQHVSTQEITRQWQQTDDIAAHMLAFLENHDEQRLASRFLLGDARAALPALLVGLCLRTSPFMLYFGQETGEEGMESEGFSGTDGRTTLFDYWCLESASRALFNRRRMTRAQRQVERSYLQLLQLARSEAAIAEGRMFDLMYVNPHLTRQYVFFRQHKDDLLLLVANFSDRDEHLSVRIPAHAVDWLGIKGGRYRATDLLSGDDTTLCIQGEKTLNVSVGGYGTRVYKMRIPRRQ